MRETWEVEEEKLELLLIMLLKDLTAALKMLGLNPLEQEVLDMTNEIAKEGFIYFPQFCMAVHRLYREDNEELFKQNLFKVS